MNNRLPELRAQHGWTQAEVGARLGVSRQTINSIEKGKYDPSLPLAFAIARLFGLVIEDVFFPDPGAASGARREPRAQRRGAVKARRG